MNAERGGMVEVLAAIAGASITVAGIGITGLSRQNQEGRESVIRLTTAVDNLTTRLETLHSDIKGSNTEIFARLGEVERSVARLEGHNDRN